MRASMSAFRVGSGEDLSVVRDWWRNGHEERDSLSRHDITQVNSLPLVHSNPFLARSSRISSSGRQTGGCVTWWVSAWALQSTADQQMRQKPLKRPYCRGFSWCHTRGMSLGLCSRPRMPSRTARQAIQRALLDTTWDEACPLATIVWHSVQHTLCYLKSSCSVKRKEKTKLVTERSR